MWASTVGTPLTGRLRTHLKRHDFRVHGWGLGPNLGLTDTLIDGLIERFEEVRKQHDRPVSVVGWSFGGVLARWLANSPRLTRSTWLRPGDQRATVARCS